MADVYDFERDFWGERMRHWVFAGAILAWTSASPVSATDLEELARQGYAVALETSVDGEFEGCEYGRRIPLINGMIFECQTYHYHYAYMPEVLILQHVRSGDIKVVIDDDEYDGVLYRA